MSRSTRGENSVVQMIGSLLDSIEGDYGVVATRLYRAFRPKPSKSFPDLHGDCFINSCSCIEQ